MATGHRYKIPHVFPDGRVEGGLFPPEYYIYPTDLFGGTWEQGLKAIEDFEWWSGPSEELRSGRDKEDVATVPERVFIQEPSVKKSPRRVDGIVPGDESTPPVEEPASELQSVHVVGFQPEETGILDDLETDMNVESVGQDRDDTLREQTVAHEGMASIGAASPPSQSRVKILMRSSPPWIPSPSKETSSVYLSDPVVGWDTTALPKEPPQLNKGSDADAEKPAMVVELEDASTEAPDVGETRPSNPLGEFTQSVERADAEIRMSPNALDIDSATLLRLMAPAAGDVAVVDEASGLLPPEVDSPTSRDYMAGALSGKNIESRIPIDTGDAMPSLPSEGTIPDSSSTANMLLQFDPNIWQNGADTSNEQQSAQAAPSSTTNAKSFPPGNPTTANRMFQTTQAGGHSPLGTSIAYNSPQSTRSSTPDGARLLRNMPFGPRTSPYADMEASAHLPRQKNLVLDELVDDGTSATLFRDTKVDASLGPNHSISSPRADNSVNESLMEAKPAVLAKVGSNTFLARLEEAAAAAPSCTDSGRTSLRTSTTPGPLKDVSVDSPWAGALLEKILARTPDLPPSPFEAESVTRDDSLSQSGASPKSSIEVVRPDMSILGSEMSDEMSRLSLQNPHAIPSDAVTELVMSAPITPQSQTSAFEPASWSNLSVAPARVETAKPRKRANTTIKKKTTNNNKAAALFRPDESSDSDDGRPKKKQKRSALSKVKNTPRRSKAGSTATKDATATMMRRMDRSSRKASSEAGEHEAEREEEELQDMTPHSTHDSIHLSTKARPVTLRATDHTPNPTNPPSTRPKTATNAPRDVHGNAVEGMASSHQSRHPLDLGYGKRQTRGDTKYERNFRSESANLGFVEGAEHLNTAQRDEMVVGVEEMEEPEAKSRRRTGAPTRRKAEAEAEAEFVDDELYDETHSDVGTAAAPKSTKGKLTPAASAAARSVNVRTKAPTRNSTPKPVATIIASSTPKFNNKPNKYGFKSPAGPRKPRAKKSKKDANEAADEGMELETAKTEVRSGRQTRRTSAAQEQLEKEVEKQKNIGLRLRSGNGKK